MAAESFEREGKRSALSLKTTTSLRKKLEEAATNSGRSMTQEIEMRLERSFETDQLIAAFTGDRSHSQLLLRAIAKTINGIEYATDKRWVDDFETLFYCRKAVSRICRFVFGSDYDDQEFLEYFAKNDKSKEQYDRMTEDFANEALRDLGQIIPPSPTGKASDLPRRVAPDQAFDDL